MIMMVVIPIITLLVLTSLTLVSIVNTSGQANKAKKQMERITQVSAHRYRPSLQPWCNSVLHESAGVWSTRTKCSVPQHMALLC